jgi:hypothetical protein
METARSEEALDRKAPTIFLILVEFFKRLKKLSNRIFFYEEKYR